MDLLYNKYKKKIENNIVVEIDNSNGSKDNKSKDNKSKDNKSKDNSKNKNQENDIQDSLHIFLKYINIINMYLPFENIKLTKNDIPKFSESIDYNIIFKNDYISNITFNYIIDEIIRLINYNTNKNIKTNIIHFITDVICTIFNSTFFEISKFNPQLNYFYQILYTSEFYLETQTNEFIMDALEYYSNQEEIKNIDILDDEQREKLENEIENDNEEYQAIDAEDEIMDAEGMYD